MDAKHLHPDSIAAQGLGWIDEATRLPVRYEQEMLRPAEGETRLKETFSDWREFEGVRFPMTRKLEVRRDVTPPFLSVTSPAEGDILRTMPLRIEGADSSPVRAILRPWMERGV